MRLRKPSGRYGPQRTCAQCNTHIEKAYVFSEEIALCSQLCFSKWYKDMQGKERDIQKFYDSERFNKEKAQEKCRELASNIQQHEKCIQGHYKLIDKVQKQLDLAGIPKGGNILDRLEYLVEEYLTTRKYVPRISYIIDEDFK